MRIRLTTRKRRLEQVRAKMTEKIKSKIKPVFRSQFRRLERFLRAQRKGGNLRKRIEKSSGNFKNTPHEADAGSWELLDNFFKADESNQKEWDDWKKELIAVLILGLLLSVPDIGDEENDIWASRGFSPLDFDPSKIVSDFQAYVGPDWFGGLADRTFSGIEQIISDWYPTDKPIGDLINQLNQYFNENRINTIADTSASGLMSQVVFHEMTMRHWTKWAWEHFGDDVPCDDCQGKIGQIFDIGDQRPPLHPNDHCLPVPQI